MGETEGSVQIWSRRADELAALAREAGWSIDEGAPIAVVDARGAIEEAEARLRTGGAPVLLVLVEETTPALLDRLYEAGSTQVAAVDAQGGGFVQALRFAGRGLARPRSARERRGGRGSSAPSVTEWIATRLAAGEPLTIIHIGLPRFDLVNAAHGRRIGTAIVRAAERRVAAQVRALTDEAGLVARIAGPAIIAAIAGPADRAILLAARIEEALESPFRIGEAMLVLGTRIGIAGARPGDDADALFARAVSDPVGEPADLPGKAAHDSASVEALAVDVHLALSRGEVTLRFQPQAMIATGMIAGVEALARWDHPERGSLGAATLFAAAEHAGIGLALSDHIQRQVLARAAAWPASLAPLRVSLNLTAADLARPNFVETFLAHVDASGFPRGRLTLEVTETGLMADLDAAAALLAELRGAGCRVAIDDFGTGYSSLAYLKALPVDYLKIDKALAQDIGGSARDQVVVRGAIDMARSLGIAVIAEGVETEEQRRLLAAAGCALYQGFLLAEPLEETALIQLVEGAS